MSRIGSGRVNKHVSSSKIHYSWSRKITWVFINPFHATGLVLYRPKWALPPAAGEKCFKFSIGICMNCIGKMLIWRHFHRIMELLLNNIWGIGKFYLWKNSCFSFQWKCNKANTLAANATDWIGGDLNVSMNQSQQSPLQRVASRNFQSAIYTGPMGGCTSMLGQINLQLMEELWCSKRLTGDCAITNS